MTKNDYKKLQRVKEKIELKNQDIDDLTTHIEQMIRVDDFESVKKVQHLVAEFIVELAYLRELSDTFSLPQNLKIEDGYKTLREWSLDNEWELTNEEVGEFVANYLTDYVNNCVYEFSFFVKDDDIWVNSIRWKKGQILPKDVKDVCRNKVHQFKNSQVKIEYYGIDTSKVLVEELRSGVGGKRFHYFKTCRETIKWLEEHYYM